MINATTVQQTDGSLNLGNLLSKQTMGELALVLAQLALSKLFCLLNVRRVDSGIQQHGSQTCRDRRRSEGSL